MKLILVSVRLALGYAVVGCDERMAMAYLDRHTKFATDHPGSMAFLTAFFGYGAGEQSADLLAKPHASSYFFLFVFLFASVFNAVVLTRTICQLRAAGDISLLRKSDANG